MIPLHRTLFTHFIGLINKTSAALAWTSPGRVYIAGVGSAGNSNKNRTWDKFISPVGYYHSASSPNQWRIKEWHVQMIVGGSLVRVLCYGHWGMLCCKVPGYLRLVRSCAKISGWRTDPDPYTSKLASDDSMHEISCMCDDCWTCSWNEHGKRSILVSFMMSLWLRSTAIWNTMEVLRYNHDKYDLRRLVD